MLVEIVFAEADYHQVLNAMIVFGSIAPQPPVSVRCEATK